MNTTVVPRYLELTSKLRCRGALPVSSPRPPLSHQPGSIISGRGFSSIDPQPRCTWETRRRMTARRTTQHGVPWWTPRATQVPSLGDEGQG